MTQSPTRSSHNPKRSILVTGGAGFIGSHLVDKLLAAGDQLVVLDNFNTFYNPSIKRRNISNHLKHPRYKLIEGDIRDRVKVSEAFSQGPFDIVVHLAAMAGVRPSLEQPEYYMDVNVRGTQILLDEAMRSKPERFIFGSSSSVYGNRSHEAFLETDRVDRPLSPYAASKAACELACYSAHHTANLKIACLRFFTVYGPGQRPDLAIHKFCRLIDNAKPIEIYGDGHSKRDYTYIDDIVDGIISSFTYKSPGYDIINLGHAHPVELIEMIAHIEAALGKPAYKVHKDLQTGDMPYTYAGIAKAKQLLKYNPKTKFPDGIKNFVNWYKEQALLLSSG